MIPQKALDIAKAVSGVLISGDKNELLSAVSIDSRSIKNSDTFIPIVGDKFNGHDFIDDALSNGAAGFFTEIWDEKMRRIAANYDNAVAIKVDDTLKALQDLASQNIRKLDSKVVAITGSTGKTSTKNMISTILSRSKKTVSTPLNLNNEIGLPLSILKCDESTELFVLEMGMRGIGQIEELADIAGPDIGVITNIGDSHLGILGSQESIAKAKSELIKALPFEGFAVLNADDPWTPILIDGTEAKVLTFGLLPAADYCATNVYLDDAACPNFQVHTPIGKMSVRLPVPGRHGVYNALAAIAVAGCFGLDADEIEKGLLEMPKDIMRMNVAANSNGVIIINDTYNANPSSMKAALETAVAYSSRGKRIAVLGDMAELGESSGEAHYEVGRIVATLGIDVLVTVGDAARNMKRGAIDGGLSKNDIHYYLDKDEAIKFLKENLEADDVVLVKASRCMEFEEIVNNI